MADQIYYSVFTKKGLELLTEAIRNGTKLGITSMAFGDGNGSLPVPDESFQKLVNEVYRTQLNSLAPDPNNANWLRAEAIIASATGGFNIRELGLYAGDVLVAYSNYPATYKPNPSDGTARIMTFRMILQIDNVANFELVIDPDVVLATIQFVENKFAFRKRTVSDRLNDEVSILDFGEPEFFGSALIDAIKYINQSGGGIYIPARSDYILNETVSAELQNHLNVRAAKGAIITVNDQIEFLDLKLNEFEVTWLGGQIWCNFETTQDLACFRLNSTTKANSCQIENTRIATKKGRYNYGIFAVGLNTSNIEKCLIQANDYCIHFESNNTNTGDSHAMATNVSDCELYSNKIGVHILNQGVPAVEGVVIKGGSILAGDTGVLIEYTAGILNYLPPLYRIRDIHINAPRALKATAVTRIYYDNVDHQGSHSATNKTKYSGAIEVSSVTLIKITDSMFTSVVQEGGTNAHKISPLAILPIVTNDNVLGTQWSNNVVFDDNIVDLSGMTDPVIKVNNDATLDIVIYGTNKVTSGGAIISPDFNKLLRMSKTNDVSDQIYLESGTMSQKYLFENNILNINTPPAYGEYYYLSGLDENIQINSIIGNNFVVGKVLTILFNSKKIKIKNSQNLETPDGLDMLLNTSGTSLQVYFYTTTRCRVLSISSKSIQQISEIPTSTTTAGVHGQKVYSSGYIYEYIENVGWVKTQATTF